MSEELFSQLNPFLYKKCLARINQLPNNLKQQMIKEAEIMSSIGIDSNEKYKNFFYISTHLKTIAQDISGKLSDDDLAKLSAQAYENIDKYPINSILNFYKAARMALTELNLPVFDELPIKKMAYPLGDMGFTRNSPYDINKWSLTARKIYYDERRGIDSEEAFRTATLNWDVMEQQNFKAWKRFYSENGQEKYKIANDYYRSNDGSPLLPMGALQSRLPSKQDFNLLDLPSEIADRKRRDRAEQEAKEESSIAAKEDLRKKILARLTAAEKLATDPAVRDHLGEVIDIGFPEWMKILHGLKRSIQTAPMKNVASPLFFDLIIREGNLLKYQGYNKTGKFLISLAQPTPTPVPPITPGAPTQQSVAPPADPTLDQQTPPDPTMDLLSGMPPMPGPLDEQEDSEEEGKEWGDAFTALMNGEYLEEDELLVEDELYSTAQAAPTFKNNMSMEDNIGDLLVEEDDSENDGKVFEQDDVLNKALQGITVADVISRLELVANIIQNREIPRQLSFVDMQMGKLGIATFFPSLGEAIRSALESHSYMYTRIEDILSKLRGSVHPSHNLELIPEEVEHSEALDAVRQNLNQSERKEKDLAEQRKAKRESKELEVMAPPAAPVMPPQARENVEIEQQQPIRPR